MKQQPNSSPHQHREISLSLTTEQCEHLLDSLLTVVFVLNTDCHFVYVNSVSRQVWGYTPDELKGKNCLDFILDSDREKTRQFLKDEMAGIKALYFQNLICKKDKSLITTSWAARWDEADQLLYCVVRDVTEREQMKVLPDQYMKELVKQNNDMVSILERITDGFCALDQNWNVLYWNKEAEWMLGKPRSAVLGKNIWEVYPEAINTELYQQYHKAIREQTPVYFEVYYPARDIWAEVTVYPSPYGLSIFFKNINQRKYLENKLRDYQRQLTSAVIMAQEKERSLISKELHDNVNQLLTSAKLYAGLGRDGVQNSAAMMDKTFCLLQEAIDEIRKLSKRLSDPFVTEMELEDSLQELVGTIGKTNHLKITFTSEAKTHTQASANAKLAIYRILQEHLTNIVKHAEASHVSVTLQQTKDKVTLSVTDDGKGFNPDKRHEGIGLANMRSRAESLKGSFTIDSAPGKGTRLLVELPMKEKGKATAR